jgi:hypothetical protein
MNSKNQNPDEDAHRGQVEIIINGKQYKTHSGNNTVEHIRNLGAVPSDEILAEIMGGQPIDLDNQAHVEIRGGEVFASHVPSAGSS